MLKFTSLASGSSGNLYLLEDGGNTLLLEAGLSIKAIRQATGFKTSGLSGCLVTHEHGDHAKGVPGLIKSGVNVYMSTGTCEALGVSGHRVHVFEKDRPFKVGGFLVKAFSVTHDAADPVGYLIKSGVDLMLFVTDTLYLDHVFPGLTMLAMEVNHCEDLLDKNVREGIVPQAIRARVRLNHMSLRTFKRFIMDNDLSTCREIHIIHISDTNGDPELFRREAQAIAGGRVFCH